MWPPRTTLDAARPGGEGLRRTTGKDHWEVGSGIGSCHRPVRGSVLGSGHPSDSIAVSPETAVLVRAARGGQIVQPSRKSTAPAVAGTRMFTHVYGRMVSHGLARLPARRHLSRLKFVMELS